MSPPLNLNLLRSLEALLETRNLTRSAARLGLTQSAMSRHLVQLRAQFQDPLLLREGQRFVLTERAEELRLGLKAVLEQVEQLYQPPQFDPSACEREFSFAGSDYLAEYMLPDILDRVLPQAPGMRLKFIPWQAGRFDLLSDAPRPDLHHRRRGAGQYLRQIAGPGPADVRDGRQPSFA